jgi:hypothetical protein
VIVGSGCGLDSDSGSTDLVLCLGVGLVPDLGGFASGLGLGCTLVLGGSCGHRVLAWLMRSRHCRILIRE